MEFLPSYEIDFINFEDIHGFDIYMDIDNPLSDPTLRDKEDGEHTTQIDYLKLRNYIRLVYNH